MEFALSGTRKVLLGEWGKAVWVNFRYRPANCTLQDACRGKGIGLPETEWIVLASVLHQIRASL